MHQAIGTFDVDEAYGLAVDDKGNLYISDAENNRIRRLTPEGVITTVTGQGSYGFGGDGGPAAAGLSPAH